jgi:acetyl esterase/lipase
MVGEKIKETFTFKNIGGTVDVKIDVVSSSIRPSTPQPVIFSIHGGFLITGSRESFPPHWLVNAALAIGWTVVFPDYRLIPESNLLGTVEDLNDAWEWVSTVLAKNKKYNIDVNQRIVIGQSAGGLLATICAPLFKNPVPKCCVSFYGMVDPGCQAYLTPGWRPINQPEIDSAPLLSKVQSCRSNIVVSHEPTSELFPPTDDYRFQIIIACHQEALFHDWITGIDGMTERIRKEGFDAIPDKFHILYPIQFGISNKFPPTLLIHGTNDIFVDAAQSAKMQKALDKAGISNVLSIYKDQIHGFDAQLGDVDIYELAKTSEIANQLVDDWHRIVEWAK